jgi:hypothetical protein
LNHPKRQYLLTRWGTIVFADESGALLHGDFRGAPQNVYLADDGMLHIEGRPPQDVELVPAGHGTLQGLKRNGQFFCASNDGGFSASRSWLDAWERCLLITEERYRDILAILDHDWTLTGGEIVARAAITLGLDFILNFGSRKLNLAEHANALIVERAGQYVSAICFVAESWQVCSAWRFQPLIYFAIFGADHLFEMLRIALESILLFGDYAGKIFILCDRSRADLARYIPKALAASVITGYHEAADDHGRVMGRYEIAEQPVDAFQPVLYLDVDIICNAPLPPMLAACNGGDRFYSSSEHGVTVDKMEEWLGEWFGRSMFTAAGMKLSNIHGLNSGTLVFSNTHFARPVFAAIKTGFAAYRRDFPLQSWKGDQPFVSFFLQSRRLVDPTMLNEYVRYKRHNYNAAERKTGLVHFNFGVGFDKTAAMLEYLEDLKAAYLPPETSSTAPVV